MLYKIYLSLIKEFTKLDSLEFNFENEFSKIEDQFFEVLSNSYNIFYGKDYHKKRIVEGQAIIYIGFVDKKLVAASYVKRNLRRGGIAVFPENYRRLGLAKNLIQISFVDFPKQYTIISTNLDHSYVMLSLMKELNFKNASSIDEIKNIVDEEFCLLSNFRSYNGFLIFDRESERREIKREALTLMHTF